MLLIVFVVLINVAFYFVFLNWCATKLLTQQQRKVVLLISDIVLCFVGLGIFLSGLILEPTSELRFLQSEFGTIFVMPKHILLFGFLTILTSVYGVFGFWAKITFYVRFGSAILFVLSYELIIMANLLVTQKISAWSIIAGILEQAGSASFSQYLRQSNIPYGSDGEDDIENLKIFHHFFECCSGFKHSPWMPLLPNYICCKRNVSVPCSAKDSYPDGCDQKLTVYSWKRFRYFVVICAVSFFLQSIVLGVILILYNMELREKETSKQK